MRSRLSIAIIVVVLGVAGGVIAMPSASGQTVLHVVFGPHPKTKVVDVHRDGLRLGDRIAGRGSLMNEDQTERLGTTFVQCLTHRRIIDPNKGLWNCNYVLEFEDGDIMLQGLDPRGPGDYEMAVLGGTGAYAGVNGDATFTDVGSDVDAYTDVVIRFSD